MMPVVEMGSLKLAISPCPNDTYIFHAWIEGLVPGAPAVTVRLEDIDTLNQMAENGEVDVVKVSMHAFAFLRDRYALLHSGGALGRGCGPLLVARKDSPLRAAPSVDRVAGLADNVSRARVAVPGELTTAALLADLFAGGLVNRVIMPFHRIMPAVAGGVVDAGVIIHEGRFTYGSYGLHRLVDLGEWWEATTELPLPLGGIAVRRSLPRAVQAAVERAVRASIERAWEYPQEALAYTSKYAQEMDPEVCSAHIELYVNEFSRDYGPEGTAAIRHLLDMASDLGLGRGACQNFFWDEE
jgi:1,4-dihydroxy-6-naphthoate synthase